jgi:hypothetical protein
MTVRGFDHDRRAFKRLLEEARVRYVERLEHLAGADIAIAHPSNNKEVDWQRLVDGLKSDTIIVRVSSDGRAGKVHRLTDKGAVELQLQPSYSDLTAAELSQMTQELKKPGVGKSIFDGNCPAGLTKYFSLQTAGALSILSILCQGYLASQSCNAGGYPKVARRVVLEALDIMGYSKMLQSRREYVRSRHFWRPLEQSLKSCRQPDAEKEWTILCGREAGGTQASWDPVQALLDLLEKDGTPGDDIEVVARAYLELATRLGGT